ncbi:MAG: hypothetical protein A2X49_17385 [Lentisphaerae bacterium GWF2_52_8]|nr:MAG: hypothetical protein A2X49_17385 [Lentisphaerae bacterium GWF2_52_8]
MQFVTRLIMAAAFLLGAAAYPVQAGAQEKLMRQASDQLLALNAELVKKLKLKPEDIENKKVYARAKVVQKEDGASELRVEEISVGEIKQEPPPSETVYLKGTVKAQKDRTWKLSIDEVLPKKKTEPAGKAAGENEDK